MQILAGACRTFAGLCFNDNDDINRILIFVCAVVARIRRLRKSPQNVLVISHGEITVSVTLRKTSARIAQENDKKSWLAKLPVPPLPSRSQMLSCRASSRVSSTEVAILRGRARTLRDMRRTRSCQIRSDHIVSYYVILLCYIISYYSLVYHSMSYYSIIAVLATAARPAESAPPEVLGRGETRAAGALTALGPHRTPPPGVPGFC